jgi:Putative zinc dependent peptidase (DUF5700)
MHHQSARIYRLLFSAIICSAFVIAPDGFSQSAGLTRVDVRVIADEADAVLAILAKKRASQPITDADWQQLFSTEGYVRLKKREQAMQRAFEDTEFRTFVLSDELVSRAQALEETLARWKRAEASNAGRRALAYLPKDAHIRAKIYPVIKPRDNSFVFDLKTDPAIFLYLDPTVTKEQFENTLAHELHHIGYSSSCTRKRSAASAKLPGNIKNVLSTIGAFGEGVAMLAAAGSPDIHPHAVSNSEDRARWDQDMTRVNEDLKKVEKFFLDMLGNRLTEEETQNTVSSFFGIQGPWYTVGWKMAVVIEKTYGRARLIKCLCDPAKLLSTYNKAAAKYQRSTRQQLAVWSPSFIESISVADRQARGR